MLKVVEVRLPRTKESPVSSQFKYGLTALIAVTVLQVYSSIVQVYLPNLTLPDGRAPLTVPLQQEKPSSENHCGQDSSQGVPHPSELLCLPLVSSYSLKYTTGQFKNIDF